MYVLASILALAVILQAVIAVVVATLIGGVFEVNLGDSEVLTLFLAIVSLGYAAIGIGGRFQVGLGIPFTLFLDGDEVDAMGAPANLHLRESGIGDIRLPYPVNPVNADRVIALLDKTRLSIIVDDMDVARGWSDAMTAAGKTLDVLVKVDVGFHRCGINPAAVEWMHRFYGSRGKVVWLPTFDSESQVKLNNDKRPFAPVVRDGRILPEVLAVIDLAAKHDLVLEMGHSSPQESLLIIPEAKRRGVRNVVVTHAMSSPGGSMNLEQLKEAAKQGALLELVWSPLTDEQLTKEAELTVPLQTVLLALFGVLGLAFVLLFVATRSPLPN